MNKTNSCGGLNHGAPDHSCLPLVGPGRESSKPGWYAYSGGRQVMIFHLRDSGQWSAHFDNGTAGDCAWGYVEQALSVWSLVPIAGVDL